MTPIIAGRFEQEAQADRAAEALRQQGFAAEDVTVFYLNPPGQHATFPVGGDRDKSHGATHAHSGALKGAAIGGVVGLGVGVAADAAGGTGGRRGGRRCRRLCRDRWRARSTTWAKAIRRPRSKASRLRRPRLMACRWNVPRDSSLRRARPNMREESSPPTCWNRWGRRTSSAPTAPGEWANGWISIRCSHPSSSIRRLRAAGRRSASERPNTTTRRPQ